MYRDWKPKRIKSWILEDLYEVLFSIQIMRKVPLEESFRGNGWAAYIKRERYVHLVAEVIVGWFGTSETTLHSGEGPIYSISWRGQYIAWANDAVFPLYRTRLIIGGENMAHSISSTNYLY